MTTWTESDAVQCLIDDCEELLSLDDETLDGMGETRQSLQFRLDALRQELKSL